MSTPPPPPPGANQFPPPPPITSEGAWSSGPGTHGGPAQPYGSPAAYASWGSRVGATLLRAIMLIPAYLPAAIGVAIGSAISDALGVVLALVGVVYFFAVAVRVYIQRGHLGTDTADAVLGQQLVRESSGQPMGSGWSIFGRNLLSFINSLPFYLGWLWPLWDAKRQTFVDKVLGTIVVEQQPRRSGGELYRNALEVWKPVIRS